VQTFLLPLQLFLFINIFFPVSFLFLLFIFRDILSVFIRSSFGYLPVPVLGFFLYFFLSLFYITLPLLLLPPFSFPFCFHFFIICISLVVMSFFTDSVLSARFFPFHFISSYTFGYSALSHIVVLSHLPHTHTHTHTQHTHTHAHAHTHTHTHTNSTPYPGPMFICVLRCSQS